MPEASRIPLRDYPARRIALIKPSALGDLVQSLPVLTALRQRFPQAHIAWVVNRSSEALLHGHPDLDATLSFDRTAGRAGYLRAALSYSDFLRRFRRQGFDLVVDLQGLLRSGLMAAVSGAARRVGLSSAREGATRCYTDVVPVADFLTMHAVDRYWLVAEAFGAGDGPKCFRLPPIHSGEQQWVEAMLASSPRPWLVLGVGARWATKRWPTSHFAALTAWAQTQFGGTALFVGGHDETPLARAVAARLYGPTRDLTGQTSLPQLTALLARADVVVANDTGPLHLAAALGRPVVAPYLCTKVLLNGPYGAAGGAVETQVWCQGSYLKRCSRLECMAELTPDRVWPLLQGVLRAWQSSPLSACSWRALHPPAGTY